MSDRLTWLERWCPACGAAPGARCRVWRWGRRGAHGHYEPAAQLHAARGWLERPCPTCKALSGEGCCTPTGKAASKAHAARLRPARWELVRRAAVWEELKQRDAMVAVVPFSGQAGRGGRTDVIQLLRLEGETLAGVERWTGHDELCNVLEALAWDRFGTFNGHPLILGEVIWTGADRQVVIVGRRGDRKFEETAG